MAVSFLLAWVHLVLVCACVRVCICVCVCWICQMKGNVPACTRHDNDVVALAWLDIPSRLLITGGKDGMVKVWR